MSGLKGDFIGFTFKGIHSSQLGITRVSEGSRYKVPLLPDIEDNVTQIKGRDGEIYYNSTYLSKTKEISIAFDSLTEKEYRVLKNFLNGKDIGELYFDETPYKSYIAKIKQINDFNFICFDEYLKHNGIKDEYTSRIYKGEGTIVFYFYDPFEYSKYNTKQEYILFLKNKYGEDTEEYNEYINHMREWIDSSGLDIDNIIQKWNEELTETKIELNENGKIKPFLFENRIYFPIINRGDEITDFILHFNLPLNGYQKPIYLKDPITGEYEHVDGNVVTNQFYGVELQNNIEKNISNLDNDIEYLQTNTTFNDERNVASIIDRLQGDKVVTHFETIYEIPAFTLALYNNNIVTPITSLKIKSIPLSQSEPTLEINSKIQLLQGITPLGNISENIYNNAIQGGEFFKLPVTDNFFNDNFNKIYLCIIPENLDNFYKYLAFNNLNAEEDEDGYITNVNSLDIEPTISLDYKYKYI